MISEVSCDTEDRSKDAENPAIYIYKYTAIKKTVPPGFL